MKANQRPRQRVKIKDAVLATRVVVAQCLGIEVVDLEAGMMDICLDRRGTGAQEEALC